MNSWPAFTKATATCGFTRQEVYASWNTHKPFKTLATSPELEELMKHILGKFKRWKY